VSAPAEAFGGLPVPVFEPLLTLASWSVPTASLPAHPGLDALLAGAPTVLASPFAAPPDEAVKGAVRDLLRRGGFSPSGRNKPCAEYVRGAWEKGQFPRIDAVIDLTNAAALVSGLPTGTLDMDLLAPPLRFRVGPPGARYVFNRSGQELDLAGLLVLTDARGAVGSPIKDPMHAKTTPETRRVLTMVWGTRALPGRAEATMSWLEGAYRTLGAEVRRLRVSADDFTIHAG
jgi:hypothetical protein